MYYTKEELEALLKEQRKLCSKEACKWSDGMFNIVKNNYQINHFKDVPSPSLKPEVEGWKDKFYENFTEEKLICHTVSVSTGARTPHAVKVLKTVDPEIVCCWIEENIIKPNSLNKKVYGRFIKTKI